MHVFSSRAARLVASGAVLAALVGSVVVAPNAGAHTPALHRYIVRVKSDATMGVVSASAVHGGGRLVRRYRAVFPGGVFDLTAAQAAALAKDSRISSVEVDRPVRASDITSEANAPWGLDRIDERVLPTSGRYRYSSTGKGVTAYVIDTGIRPTHREFDTRVRLGYDAVGDGQNGVDCNGHGTHVAGTIGGATYGVAKGVSLVAVRVLGCDGSGSISGVIAGIDWAVADHSAGPAVINMSLGGTMSRSLDLAVDRAVADGISVVVAAGNDSGDACLDSPAHAASAITVGATDSSDAQADFSNYGSCVDLYAPGVGITSSWDTGDTATKTISGTSMATPHVVGAVARYLERHPNSRPSTVRNALVRSASSGEITHLGPNSPNKLLYVDPAN